MLLLMYMCWRSFAYALSLYWLFFFDLLNFQPVAQRFCILKTAALASEFSVDFLCDLRGFSFAFFCFLFYHLLVQNWYPFSVSLVDRLFGATPFRFRPRATTSAARSDALGARVLALTRATVGLVELSSDLPAGSTCYWNRRMTTRTVGYSYPNYCR